MEGRCGVGRWVYERSEAVLVGFGVAVLTQLHAVR